MQANFRVLLPKWVFEKSKTEKELQKNIKDYMQRYPHYVLSHIEDSFAVCERINSLKEEQNG
ncbi:hypothetical protein [Oceanobacillus damuensis]|uniref:hypothetical protein n=1 Tax=Oceanobacillus damuensis TaxID=937928 RepID=UPI00082E29EC|nr:hypothetical protein [Oceanobacillus damuensis]